VVGLRSRSRRPARGLFGALQARLALFTRPRPGARRRPAAAADDPRSNAPACLIKKGYAVKAQRIVHDVHGATRAPSRAVPTSDGRRAWEALWPRWAIEARAVHAAELSLATSAGRATGFECRAWARWIDAVEMASARGGITVTSCQRLTGTWLVPETLVVAIVRRSQSRRCYGMSGSGPQSSDDQQAGASERGHQPRHRPSPRAWGRSGEQARGAL